MHRVATHHAHGRHLAGRASAALFALALIGLAAGPASAQQGGAPPSQPAGSTTPAAQETQASPNPKPQAADFGIAHDELHLLENRLTMREPFNRTQGAIRIVAFLAPSCPKCQKNAGELQRAVLDANPDANIAVFVVWMHVLQKDDEETARDAMKRLPDPRVLHYWDPDRKLLHQLRDAIMFDVNLRLYDVFLLYGGDAVWERRVPRPEYWMHEYKGVHGPWWDVTTFAAEVGKGLRGEPFSNPLH